MTARIRSVGPEADIIAGQNVRGIRKALGWSRHELSLQVYLVTGKELSEPVIGAMERGERRITIGEAGVLADTLGITTDTLRVRILDYDELAGALKAGKGTT